MSAQHNSLYILGAGGHARVAIQTARLMGLHVAGLFDDNCSLEDQFVIGAPVMGPLGRLGEVMPLPCLIAIGDNERRAELARRFPGPWATLVHPRAFVDDTAELGQGTIVMPGAVVNANARIGEHAIINSNATVEHDCRVGNAAHVSCNACLTGGVSVGDQSLIGAGAVILPGVTVGREARVAAGAVLTRAAPDNATMCGVPARQMTSNRN
ncbi:MAG: acetyltransferase [Planctomycetales bacterium]|nr:acetyltransferase [Planctomycetales bacterium]